MSHPLLLETIITLYRTHAVLELFDIVIGYPDTSIVTAVPQFVKQWNNYCSSFLWQQLEIATQVYNSRKMNKIKLATREITQRDTQKDFNLKIKFRMDK